MNLRRIDLNLLTVFDAVMAEGSITRAALRLGMTQPALSNALTRLRRLVDDPLFIRTGNGIAPTERAERMAGPVRQALACSAQALGVLPVAPPETARRCFTLMLGEVGEAVALPAALAATRGGDDFDIRLEPQREPVDLEIDLLEGRLDLAWTPLPSRSRDIVSEPVMRDEFVCLLPPVHGAEPLTDERYSLLRHVAVRGASHEQVDRGGRQRDIAVELCHFAALPQLVARTGVAATLPKRLAEQFAAGQGLHVAPLPFDVPDLLLYQAWPAYLDGDAAHRRLRKALKAAAR
ncbi:MAG: LysR family transcriptional regulator [Parvibaculum sp.]|nr:LysR family transcriptional regulator [Parvibaculum sp.]